MAKSTRVAGRRGRRPARSRIVLRWLAVGVTVLVAFLYYHPLRTYLDKHDALQRRVAEVRSLQAEKRRLERRAAAAAGTPALLLEARRLGLVKPGERLFIVKGIPAWRKRHPSTIGVDG